MELNHCKRGIKMDEKTIQRKLNQLCKICNELHEEAQRRYGCEGNLFFESDGSFFLMDGDEDACSSIRQEHIKFSSDIHCQLGAGAW
jgi:hypothetical protein